MAREDGPEFVRWREEFVSQERGSRVVHYYLEDAAGDSHLAVVGTERSLRHMLYVVSDDFHAAQGCDGVDGGPARKWRSRREVVDWLASFIPVKALASKYSNYGVYVDNDIGLDRYGETDSFVHENLGKACDSDITWSGSFWTCGKQLRHYQAFCRNGTTISTHSFVLVLSEDESRHLAYLEDMYEDKKGQKKVKVRWFHQNKEFSCVIPPPPPHPCEVFITPFTQVISVECVDDIATVLTPDHYERCRNALPSSSLVGIRFCFRQYSKNKFKHFDLRTLRGYFSQATVLSSKISAEPGKDSEYCTSGKTKSPKQFERPYSKCLGTKICRGPQEDSIPSYQRSSNRQPPGKHFSIKFVGLQNQLMQTYSAGDKIEILSQDSGIIGCWFRCTVLKSCTNHNKLKVQYDDLQDADDCGRLEEMVPVSTLALPDKLGMRCPDRLRIRPRPKEKNYIDVSVLLPGTAVDVWQFSGWWEGVVVSLDNTATDSLQIYFPGENFFGVCQLKNIRISKDWVKNRWIDIETKSDVLSRIPSDGIQTKQPENMSSVGVLDSSGSAVPGQEVSAVQANYIGDKQKEATDKTSSLVEDEKHTILGKRPWEEDAEHIGDKQKEASEQTEVCLTDKTSTFVEDEKHTILGKRPREEDAEHIGDKQKKASNQTEVCLTDKTSSFVEDEEQTILGQRHREEDAEDIGDKQKEASKQTEVYLTDKTSSFVEDEEQTILGKHHREEDVEHIVDKQKVAKQTEVCLIDKTSSFVEEEKETILGKRPREEDAELDCNGEVGLDVGKT